MNPDLEIVPLALAGDKNALAALVPQYHREIESAVLKYLGPARPHEVDDAVQAVWVKLFERIDRFDPKRGVKFSTWLYALARNHCFDILKKRRLPMRSLVRRGEDGDDQVFDPPARATQPPEIEASNRELLRRYRLASETLAPEQRRVFELRAAWGLEFSEIARQRGIPLGTAKTLFYRARIRLRDEFDRTPRAA